MGNAPSAPTEQPKERSYEYGPWQVSVLMLIGATLLMSQMDDMPAEGLAFYILLSRLTLMSIIATMAHRLYHSWAYANEVRMWNEVQEQAKLDVPVNPEKAEPRKAPFSYWDIAARAHPSAFLTTTLTKPKFFPFPVGLADPVKSKALDMVWESGLPPAVGKHKMGGHMDYKKRSAYKSAIAAKISEDRKKQEERTKIYDNQRKQLVDRIWHLKLLSSLVVMAFISKRLAILLSIPFLYSVFNSEMENMIRGGKSGALEKEKKYRKGNRAREKNYKTPDMGVAYLYQPDSTGIVSQDAVYHMPQLESAPPLMTSLNDRLAGDGHTEKTQPTWFEYGKDNVDGGDAGGYDFD